MIGPQKRARGEIQSPGNPQAACDVADMAQREGGDSPQYWIGQGKQFLQGAGVKEVAEGSQHHPRRKQCELCWRPPSG